MLRKTLAIGLFLALLVIGGRAHAAMITGGTNINLNNGYQCVEVAGGYTTPGTAVQSWDCWGGFNQQWNLYQGQLLGIGSEISGNNIRNCMQVSGASSGSVVVMAACNGQQNQQWILSGGHIVSALSNFCLDLGAGYTTSGVQLTVTPCSTSLSQMFAIR